MKLIVAGTRDLKISMSQFLSFVNGFDIYRYKLEVVSGNSGSIDRLGIKWADEYRLPFKVFNAEWEKHGKSAGPIRNREMAKYADALLLIWDGKSRGSKNMKQEMERLGKPVYEAVFWGGK